MHLSLKPVQFSSVAQACLTLCDPMNCSTPGFPVHHQVLELAETHTHLVGDTIQLSHPLLSSETCKYVILHGKKKIRLECEVKVANDMILK